MTGKRRNEERLLGQPAWLWSLAAFLVGLALALLATWMHHTALAYSERVQLERRAERSFDAVEIQLKSCGLLVRSVQALFLASDEVTPGEFDSIYSNLHPRQLFPSLQAIALSGRQLLPDERGLPREHFITTMVAPRAGNERVYGLDIASQPANLLGLRRSRGSDQPALSAAFTLIQRHGLPGAKDGVTIRLPAYSPGLPPRDQAERRRRFIGSVGASFRVGGLIERSLPPDTRESMDVRVLDVTDGQRWPLFASTMTTRAAGAPAALDHRFGRDIHYMSAQYRDSEARFRALNQLLPTLVLLASTDGRLVYANQSARTRLQLPDASEVEQPLFQVFGSPSLTGQMRDVVDLGLPLRNASVRCAGAAYSPFWASLSVSRIELDGRPHLLAVATDISELRDLNEMLSYQATHEPARGLRENRRQLHPQHRDRSDQQFDRAGGD